jgi:hypothetical protein
VSAAGTGGALLAVGALEFADAHDFADTITPRLPLHAKQGASRSRRRLIEIDKSDKLMTA